MEPNTERLLAVFDRWVDENRQLLDDLIAWLMDEGLTREAAEREAFIGLALGHDDQDDV